jgi:2-hydroxychromene-2-carboxylate isomerase
MVNPMITVEFHFDFGSPNAYLSHLVIPEIEKRTGGKFEYVPVLLGGVFKLTNNRSPAETLRGIRNNPSTSGSKRSASSGDTGSRAFRTIPIFL